MQSLKTKMSIILLQLIVNFLHANSINIPLWTFYNEMFQFVIHMTQFTPCLRRTSPRKMMLYKIVTAVSSQSTQNYFLPSTLSVSRFPIPKDWFNLRLWYSHPDLFHSLCHALLTLLLIIVENWFTLRGNLITYLSLRDSFAALSTFSFISIPTCEGMYSRTIILSFSLFNSLWILIYNECLLLLLAIEKIALCESV